MKNKNIIPKVAAVHDMSGFGKCSLTVAIPVLSAMGIEVCPLPTAILSTHTGGFEGYTLKDLTDEMPEIIKHWHSLDINFDCIYSGFMASAKQIDIVSDFINIFRNDNFIAVVDPVLADNGKLYSTMNEEMVEKMKSLVSKADLITPNVTEAFLLLGKKYTGNLLSDEMVKTQLRELSEMGPNFVVITSVVNETGNLTVVAYERDENRFWRVNCDFIKGDFHGTGDIFTSVLVGAFLSNNSLPSSLSIAAEFVSQSIRQTFGHSEISKREGVLFERALPLLQNSSFIGNYEEF